jgi:hypothetical protein
MRMLPLISRCLAQEPNAWSVLYHMVNGAALTRVRAVLRRNHVDGCLADDVFQLVYFILCDDDYRVLRSFAGRTRRELQGYLGSMAALAAQNLVKKELRSRWLLHTAGRLARPDRSGPSEAELLQARADFKASMTAKEQERLEELWQLPHSSEMNAGISERTRRDWQRRLVLVFKQWHAGHGD